MPTATEAIFYNLLSWLLVVIGWRLPSLTLTTSAPCASHAILVEAPGGLEQLALTPLELAASASAPEGASTANAARLVTVGYNVTACKRLPRSASLAWLPAEVPADHVIVRIQAFSINYADVTIRWGLYESAIRYVGYPICPGFDFAGVVEEVGEGVGVASGARVFGITFFGAYSERVLVPANQVRPLPTGVPKTLTLTEAAALPCACGTALHALKLAGFWPVPPVTSNRAVLIHSAGGGVGSMLVQMARALGCRPVVGVVGAPHKVASVAALGADVVIDKSSTSRGGLWKAAADAAPGGYAAVFDANGVATLAASYAALAQTGTLVVYGFHSNLPNGAMLHPLAWVRMISGVLRMPRFEPMGT